MATHQRRRHLIEVEQLTLRGDRIPSVVSSSSSLSLLSRWTLRKPSNSSSSPWAFSTAGCCCRWKLVTYMIWNIGIQHSDPPSRRKCISYDAWSKTQQKVQCPQSRYSNLLCHFQLRKEFRSEQSGENVLLPSCLLVATSRASCHSRSGPFSVSFHSMGSLASNTEASCSYS